MALDFFIPFNADDIAYVDPLAPGHPVFMLNGFDADRLVIKLESVKNQAELKFTAKFMSAVDPNSKAKVLGQSEVAALREWTNRWENRHDDESGAKELSEGLSSQGSWTKMRALRLQTLDTAVDGLGQGDKAGVRSFAKALNAPGGLEKLGEIVAADLFNGNRDRFNPDTGVTLPDGTSTKCLNNVGNVFLMLGPDGQRNVAGLDAFDVWNPIKFQHANWIQTDWKGALLADNQRSERLRFARQIVDDLNHVLGARNRKIAFGRTKRLEHGAEMRVNTGMESGARKLRDRARQYLIGNQQRCPPGLLTRLKLLGWYSR